MHAPEKTPEGVGGFLRRSAQILAEILLHRRQISVPAEAERAAKIVTNAKFLRHRQILSAEEFRECRLALLLRLRNGLPRQQLNDEAALRRLCTQNAHTQRTLVGSKGFQPPHLIGAAVTRQQRRHSSAHHAAPCQGTGRWHSSCTRRTAPSTSRSSGARRRFLLRRANCTRALARMQSL